jgi:flagellar basal body-associated protein FliL
MSIGLGIGLVLLAVVLAGVVFWFSSVARDIFREEYDEHGRGG